MSSKVLVSLTQVSLLGSTDSRSLVRVTDAILPDWALDLHSALDDRMGIVLEHVTAQEARGRMPVEGNTQPVGRLHGGASCVLAESLGSVAAWAHARTLGKIAFGVDINTTHHRGAASGYVHGTATAIHLGSTSACYEVILTDDEGRRTATARITCALVEPR